MKFTCNHESAQRLFAAAVAGLDGQPDLLVDGGPIADAQASTVISLTGPAPQLLRAGPLPFDRILAALA